MSERVREREREKFRGGGWLVNFSRHLEKAPTTCKGTFCKGKEEGAFFLSKGTFCKGAFFL